MKFITQVDPRQFKSKPDDNEVGGIRNRLKLDSSLKELTVNELANYISAGHSFNISCHGGDLATFAEQYIFGLDYDTGIQMLPELQKYIDAGYQPNIIYNTFSSTTEHPKFRFIWCTTGTDDIEISKITLRRLQASANSPDASCKDPSRIFYAGTNVVVLTEQLYDFNYFFGGIDAMSPSDTRSRTSISDRKYMSQTCSPLDIYKSSATLRQSPDSFFMNSIGMDTKQLDFHGSRTSFEIQYAGQLYEEIKLFRDFNSRELKNNELFILSTHMNWLRGGLSYMKSKMQELDTAGITAYKDKDYNIIRNAKYYGYIPMDFRNLGASHEDYNKQNSITQIIFPKGRVDAPIIPTITVSEAETQMKDFFNAALESPNKDIYILKVETGIGKSKLLEELSYIDNITLAFTTHKLKEEMMGRVKEAYASRGISIDPTCTPEVPEFEDEVLGILVNKALRRGDTEKYNALLRNAAENCHLHVKDGPLAKQFMGDLVDAYSNEGLLFSTHCRALKTKFMQDTIIFDEDPFMEMMGIGDATSDSIKKLVDHLASGGFTGAFHRHLTSILNLPVNGTIKTGRTFVLSEDEATHLKKDRDLYLLACNLCDASVVRKYENYRENRLYVSYATPTPFRNDKKILVMSATADVDLYKEFYPDRNIHHIDITSIEKKGAIVQHTSKSFGSGTMENKDSIPKRLREVMEPVITHKSRKHHFKSSVEEMHFGNCSGYDSLGGKDLLVIGTPHKPEHVYKMIASILGAEYDETERIKTRLIQTAWGARTKFPSFESAILQKIQFWCVESDLVQAIGRSRVLRNGCKVEVYSNYPIKGAKFVH